MIITLLSKIIGFLRDMTLSYYYGVSHITDAFLISMTIPTVIITIIGVGISASYIPLYSRVLDSKGKTEADNFTKRLVNLILIISFMIILIVLIFTPFFVKIFAFGFEGELLNLTVNFTRISILGTIFTCLIFVYSSYLDLHNKFLVTVMVGLPINLLAILFVLLSYKYNVYLLVIGSVIGVAIQLFLLMPSVYKLGYRHKTFISFRDGNIISMLVLSLPVIIGVSIDQINVLVDRTIASGLTEGAISAITYSNRINIFVEGLFVLAISKVVFPKIASFAVKGDLKLLKQWVIKSINIINLLIVPSTIIFLTFSVEIIQLLYGRGAFDKSAVNMTSSTLFYYSIGMLGYGYREIISKTYYSLGDTKTPTINAAIAVILNIVLNIILSRYLGVSGLALATSIAGLVSSCLLYISLYRKVGSLNTIHLFKDFTKFLISSVIMAYCSKQLNEVLVMNINPSLSLMISMIVGFFIYLILLYLLRVDELKPYINFIEKKLFQ